MSVSVPFVDSTKNIWGKEGAIIFLSWMCTGLLRYFVQFIKVLVSTCIPEPTPYRDRFISIYSKWAFDSINTNRKGFLGPLTLVAPKLSRFFLLGFYILSNLWTREFHQKKLKGKDSYRRRMSQGWGDKRKQSQGEGDSSVGNCEDLSSDFKNPHKKTDMISSPS